MAGLEFYRGEDPLIEVRLHPGRITIGRADTCDVALPGEAISRVHCLVEGRGNTWRLIDRSRHGTLLNGAPVRNEPLADGDRIGIGPYEALIRMEDTRADRTAESMPDHSHELLVAADESLHLEHAVLVVVDGPGAPGRFRIQHARVTIGSSPSTIDVGDPGLLPEHMILRVSRGRTMVEPGRGAAYLDGCRVRQITPVFGGETLRLGQTTLSIQVETSSETPHADHFGDMIGSGSTMQRMFGLLRRVAAHDTPLLILGESGTGKELAARGVHQHGSRAARPFIPVNCGAITEGLYESELFGHEKGAFTGATNRTDGAFHRAHGGTLFLDEVGELPESAQVKLLRTLEDGGVRRVGGARIEYPDVRIIAATNRDLQHEVREGHFRADLFFRLAVLVVHLPPLKARPEDLPILCRELIRRHNIQATLSQAAVDKLAAHDWPGNIRELRNVLHRAHVLGGRVIETDALSFHDLGPSAATPGATGSLEQAEREHIARTLQTHGGNRSAAARTLGIARSSLHYKMKRMGLT
ncbi:MAG: sigma 54-interacting transcriptional regulator [Myxococcota bacterium]|jgi:transcriptional regulator with AAA-type ATPase domain|nr:sigma 54-interacting transcriptional regulator [Myxococcota bacterium]